MLGFKTQCERTKQTFFVVIDENPMAATLMLGNLSRSLKKAPDQAQPFFQTTLSVIKEKMTKAHVQVLFDTATTVSKARLSVMSETNVATLDTLKHQMITDIDFFKHVSADSLIKLGQEMPFYREVLVALIRKHQDENKQPDPFKETTFSYDLLAQGASEQNSSYLSSYIKACATLPVDNIVLLGAKDSEIATLILIDVKDSKIYFEASNRFVELHANLRQSIATEWKTQIETIPLTIKEETFTQSQLPILKETFQEFKEVKIDERVPRNIKVEPAKEKSNIMLKLASGAGLASAGMAVGLTYSLAQLGFVMLVPPLAVTAPVCYGATFGAYYLRNKKWFSQEISVPPATCKENSIRSFAKQ